MADLIKIKGGNGNVPDLQDRELGYSRDEKALYIGTEDGNVRLGGSGDIVKVNALTARVTAIEGNLTEADEKITDIEARLPVVEKGVADTAETLADMDARITAIEKSLASIIARVEILETPGE